MRHSRFSQQQIARILRDCESGRRVAEVCKEHGISSSTIYAWRTRFARRAPHSEARMETLEAENRRLRQRLLDLSLDYESLKGEVRRMRASEQTI